MAGVKLYLVFCDDEIPKKETFAKFFKETAEPETPVELYCARDNGPVSVAKFFANQLGCQAVIDNRLNKQRKAPRRSFVKQLDIREINEETFEESDDQFISRLRSILVPPFTKTKVCLIPKDLRKHLIDDSASAVIQILEEDGDTVTLSSDFPEQDWQNYLKDVESGVPPRRSERYKSPSSAPQPEQKESSTSAPMQPPFPSQPNPPPSHPVSSSIPESHAPPFKPSFPDKPATQPVQTVPAFQPAQTVPAFQPAQTVPAFQPGQTAPAFQPGQTVPAFQPGQTAPAFKPGQTVPAFQPAQTVPASKPGQTVPAFQPGPKPSIQPPNTVPPKSRPTFPPSKPAPFIPSDSTVSSGNISKPGVDTPQQAKPFLPGPQAKQTPDTKPPPFSTSGGKVGLPTGAPISAGSVAPISASQPFSSPEVEAKSPMGSSQPLPMLPRIQYIRDTTSSLQDAIAKEIEASFRDISHPGATLSTIQDQLIREVREHVQKFTEDYTQRMIEMQKDVGTIQQLVGEVKQTVRTVAEQQRDISTVLGDVSDLVTTVDSIGKVQEISSSVSYLKGSINAIYDKLPPIIEKAPAVHPLVIERKQGFTSVTLTNNKIYDISSVYVELTDQNDPSIWLQGITLQPGTNNTLSIEQSWMIPKEIIIWQNTRVLYRSDVKVDSLGTVTFSDRSLSADTSQAEIRARNQAKADRVRTQYGRVLTSSEEQKLQEMMRDEGKFDVMGDQDIKQKLRE